MPGDTLDFDGGTQPYETDIPLDKLIGSGQWETIYRACRAVLGLDPVDPAFAHPALISEEALADLADLIDDARAAWSLPAWTWDYQAEPLVSALRLNELRRATPRQIEYDGNAALAHVRPLWRRCVATTGSTWPPTQPELLTDLAAGMQGRLYSGATLVEGYRRARQIVAFDALHETDADAVRAALRVFDFHLTLEGRTWAIGIIQPAPVEPPDDEPATAAFYWNLSTNAAAAGSIGFGAPDVNDWHEGLQALISGYAPEGTFALVFRDAADTSGTAPPDDERYYGNVASPAVRWSMTPPE